MNKRLIALCLFLTMVLGLVCGCGKRNQEDVQPPAQDILLDKEYCVYVAKDADNTTQQAAKLLLTTLDWKMKFAPELKYNDPGQKAICVAVDTALAAGEYKFEIRGTSLYITAGSPHVLLYAAKVLRQTLLESDNPKLVTVSTCQSLCGTVDVSNLPFTFISQNILFKNIEGGNTVAERAPRYEDLILEYAPDILGIQENSASWVAYNRSFFGKTYFEINQEGVTYLFRADRYELVETKHFYLSPTPDVKSQFPGDSGPRAACWAIVKDLLTGKELFLCNAHLDWNNDTQRALQLEVLIEQLTPYFEKYPTLACGDYNSEPDGPIYARATEIFTHAKDSAARNISTIDFTSHGFGASKDFIDYIFHDDAFKVNLYYILNDDYGGFVSDHYGVLAEFTFA